MYLKSVKSLSTSTTWSLLLLMFLLTTCCYCCDYRPQPIHCKDKEKDFLRIPSLKLSSNDKKNKMRNLSNHTNEGDKMKKPNEEAHFGATRNARIGFIPDSKFITIGSTISGTNSSSILQDSVAAAVTLSHYNPAANPFFGLKRLPTEKTMLAADHEDWKPITFSPVIAKTTTSTASTKVQRNTKITKPKIPSTRTATTTKTINSVFKLTSELKTADDGTIRPPMNSIIYGVPKAKETSSASPSADTSLNKQDSVVHDINYYQALSKTDGGEFRKTFLAFNKGSSVTDGDLPDSTTVQLMGQYYGLNERNINRQKESAAKQKGTKLTTIDTIFSITTAPEHNLTSNEINNNNHNKNNSNSKNKNRTVVPETNRKEIIRQDEMINTQTEASTKIYMDEARRDSTWLEIASSNSTSIEFGNQYRMNTEQEQQQKKLQEQQEEKEKPLDTNKTTWPLRSSSSASSEKETETQAARGTETGTGTAIRAATRAATTTLLTTAKAELDDIELDDESLVTIHMTATASTNDPNVSPNSTQPSPTSKTTICVPMLVREKSSAHPDVFMDVERVVCFPLPPEMDLNFGDMKNERNDDSNYKKNDFRMNDDVNDLNAVDNVNDVLAEKVQTDFGLQSDFEEQEIYSKCSRIQQNYCLFVKTSALFLLLWLFPFQV